MILFQNLTYRYFDKIAAQYDLKVFNSNIENIVQYENNNVILTIAYDSKNSYELTVSICLKQQSQRCYFLSEILDFDNSIDASWVSRLQVANPVTLEKYLEKLSFLTEKHASNLLAGDINAFQKMDNFQTLKSIDYALETKTRIVREKAEDAWQKRNYEGVIAAYSQIMDYLSNAETMRFEYAKKMLKEKC